MRVCSLAAIASGDQKLTTLRQLKQGLDLAIADLDRQKRAEQIANKGLLVARFAKLTCDAFVEMAADMAKAVLPKAVAEEAELVAKVSKLGSTLAGATSTFATGGHVDPSATSVAEDDPRTPGETAFTPDRRNGGLRQLVHAGDDQQAALSSSLL